MNSAAIEVITESGNKVEVRMIDVSLKTSYANAFLCKLRGMSEDDFIKKYATKVVIAARWSKQWSEEDVMEIDSMLRESFQPHCLIEIQSSLRDPLLRGKSERSERICF